MDRYPNGVNVQEVENLLSDALINTNNYLRAIEHMENMRSKSDRIKSAYQKVAFFQGVAYFRDNKFGSAVQFFNKSLQYPIDKSLMYQAQFWIGETFAANKEIPQAINAYEKLIKMNPPTNDPSLIKSHFGLGYAYFNNERYEEAEKQFKAYTDKLRNNSEKENYDDALIRLGDTYYVQKKFEEALATFNRAVREENKFADYAYFRAGVVLNFQNRNAEALRKLDQVANNYPNSLYFEDALFQKAQINMEDSRYREGRDGFSALINTRPDSPFMPYALEGRAVANYSLQDYDKAIEDYKKILVAYPNSENVETALVGLQESLSLQGRSEEFSRYLTDYRKTNPSSSNLQNVEFEAAKSLIFNQSYEEAVRSFESFIRNYPNSTQVPEAKYYLGDAYFRLGDKDKALDIFYDLENTTDNNLKNRVFQNIASIEFEYGNFDKAIPYFRYSVVNARNKIEEFEANNGLMAA
ncbi:MAG: tetratricopeptide repeat protein, partial [Cyclobacteriaceae bacterium]